MDIYDKAPKELHEAFEKVTYAPGRRNADLLCDLVKRTLRERHLISINMPFSRKNNSAYVIYWPDKLQIFYTCRIFEEGIFVNDLGDLEQSRTIDVERLRAPLFGAVMHPFSFKAIRMRVSSLRGGMKEYDFL